MEFFSATGQPPIQVCLSSLEKCNVYLGIIGYQYGSIDKSTSKSYTQLEYEHARHLKGKKLLKDIWIFLPSSKCVLEKEYYDIDEMGIAKLNKFKNTLGTENTVEYYDSLEDLAVKIVGRFYMSLYNVIEELSSKGGIAQSMRPAPQPEAQQIATIPTVRQLTLSELEKERLAAQINEVNRMLKAIGRETIDERIINVKSVAQLGNYYTYTKQYDKAKEAYELILKSYPNDPKILNNLGIVYTFEKDWNSALKLLQRAKENAELTDEKYTDPHVNLGYVLSETGRPSEAIEILQKVYEKEKDDYVVLLNLGVAYTKLKDADRAHEYYSLAEKVAPHDPLVLVNIALLYQSEKDYRKAVEYCEKVLRLDANHVEALATKGSSLTELSMFIPGLYYLNRAIKINPKETTALANLALVYRKLQDFGMQLFGDEVVWTADLVEFYSEKVLEIDKEDVLSLGQLGWVLDKCGSHLKAIELFDKALRIDSRRVGAAMDKAMTLADSGDFDAGLKTIDDLHPEENNDWELLLLKCQMLHKAGRADQVREELQKITRIKPMWKFFSSRFFARIEWTGIALRNT